MVAPVDTILTVATVAAVAFWAVLRLARRRPASASDEACAGCPADRRP